MTTDCLPLAVVCNFEALHCQPSIKVDRSTTLDLTTSAPIAANDLSLLPIPKPVYLIHKPCGI